MDTDADRRYFRQLETNASGKVKSDMGRMAHDIEEIEIYLERPITQFTPEMVQAILDRCAIMRRTMTDIRAKDYTTVRV